ncbi:alcohol dehydrogenase [Eremomyces bilateralis CBS 781.70]|uniref:Alcohol dehydrogenase n=1 Tax=Eremomyces bilateralis CBS 781.70 TaxID=1392243 RepID=A0A6G1GB03_9PEZI|nr:alcohol dehydrogenase [Eremomyces bilateralis CBS 781.70]KAF1815277.1 alcohol dehydrogenase [Eremomyces bilateralis CBS 781.70]
MSPPTLPKTYRAVVVEGPNQPLAIKEFPLEEPKPGEILIKVHCCGVCHSDELLIKGLFGPMAKFPAIPGHETIGTIVRVGSGEKRWEIGEVVGGAWHGGHDGVCKSCSHGDFQMCDNAEVNGVTRSGGYAEYAYLRTEAAVHIPKEIPASEYPAIAPLLCAGVTVFNGIREMDITPGGTVVIQGLGGLGHLALQFARKMGYRTVALSSSEKKRDFALDLGATDYIDASKDDAAQQLQAMGGANLIVVTAPNPEVVPPLLSGLAARGKLLILAPVGDVPVNTGMMILRGISVWGWPSGHARDAEETIDFANRQGVDCMIEKFPMDDVQNALDQMNSGNVRFRGVLMME